MILKKHHLIYLLLLTLTILSLVNFVKIGFTNSDDSDCYLRALNGNILADSAVWAEGQGRFFFYFRNPIASFPYLFDSFIWIKLTQYLPIIINFVLLSYIISKALKSEILGYISYTFFIIFFSIPVDEFTPPIAYPFTFTLDVCFFLISIINIIRFKTEKKYKYFIYSLILFYIPFFGYESYIVFLPLYTYSCIYSYNNRFSFKLLIARKSLHITIPIFSLTILYLAIYTGYRFSYSSNYIGNTIPHDINIKNLLSFTLNLNNNAYPTVIFFNNAYLNTNGIQNFHLTIQEFITKTDLTSLIYYLISICLLIYLFNRINFNGLKTKTLLVLLLIILSHCYLINIIPGIATKYNSGIGMTSYVTTYIAYYGITISILIFILIILKTTSRLNRVHNLIKNITILIITLLTLVVNVSNKQISKEWQKSNFRFEVIDYMAKNEYFNKIEQNAVICSPQLFNVKSYVGNNVVTNTFSWSRYIAKHTNKKYYICQTNQDIKLIKKEYNPKKLYYLSFSTKNKKIQIKIKKSNINDF